MSGSACESDRVELMGGRWWGLSVVDGWGSRRTKDRRRLYVHGGSVRCRSL
jgi:hypothetical protein